jgi:hypothetical protein
VIIATIVSNTQIAAVIESTPTITATILPRGAAGYIDNSQVDGGRADSNYAATAPIDGGNA